MRVSRTVVAAVSGAAVSSVVTAAILLPTTVFANTADTTDDRGECVTFRKTIPRAEAEDLLAAEGLVPAEGALDGYEIGYVPDYVGDAAYDLDDELWAFDDEIDMDLDEEEPSGTIVTRYWLGDEVELWTDTAWGEDEEWVDWDGPLYVDVERSEHLTDIDALLEEYGGYDDYFADEEVHELPDGVGYYTGYEAMWVPEPGVAITLWLDPEDETDEFPDGGSAEEVRAIVDGIEPADA